MIDISSTNAVLRLLVHRPACVSYETYVEFGEYATKAPTGCTVAKSNPFACALEIRTKSIRFVGSGLGNASLRNFLFWFLHL